MGLSSDAVPMIHSCGAHRWLSFGVSQSGECSWGYSGIYVSAHEMRGIFGAHIKPSVGKHLPVFRKDLGIAVLGLGLNSDLGHGGNVLIVDGHWVAIGPQVPPGPLPTLINQMQ